MEEYQGWQYKATFKSGQVDFEVVPSVKNKKPNSFFKYYSVNPNSVEALTKYYVYASHPNQLNDSLDCNSQILDFQHASIEDMRELYEPFYSEFLRIHGGEDALKVNMSNDFKILVYRRVGIISLAVSNGIIYFWNTYAESGRGFCVEWNVDKFPFRLYGPFPMHYVDTIRPFEVCNNMSTSLLIQTNVKTRDWKDEHEWRLLVSNPNGLDFNTWELDGSYSERFNFGDEHDRKMRIPLEAVKSVTLGERFFRSSDIRCLPITSEEMEVVFLNKKEHLRCNVLDFLTNNQFAVKWIGNELGELIVCPIAVVKLQRNVYRIIKI